MATSKKSLNDSLRNRYLEIVSALLAETNSDEILVTKSNEIALPCVDSEGNDKFVVITFKVPTGSRDGDAYDGYAEAESYKLHVAEMTEKAKASAAKKAAKKEADEKRRAKKEEEGK